MAKIALPKLTPALLWRVGLGVAILICLVLGVMLWLSGTGETQQAFLEGRRLIITLDNGSVEGKQIGSEDPPETPAVTTSGETATAPAKPAEASKPTATPAPAAPAPAPTPTPMPKPADSAGPKAEAAPVIVAPAPVNLADMPAVQPSTVKMAGPNPALTEKSTDGPLPVTGGDGTKPWRYYSRPHERQGNLPMIAIVVTGLGEGKAVSDAATKLPETVTLSFNPYGRDVASWITTARTTGHEVMLDLPMEPNNYPASDPGPQGLIVEKGQAENDARLQWLMSRFQTYIGFVTPQNEVYSANDDAFKSLMQTFSKRGLLLLLGREPAKKETKDMLTGDATASLIGDLLIDEELSPAAIQSRLTTLEQIAKQRGYAIGIAQAYPLTVQQLNVWSGKLSQDGFVLVPLSFIAKSHYS